MVRTPILARTAGMTSVYKPPPAFSVHISIVRTVNACPTFASRRCFAFAVRTLTMSFVVAWRTSSAHATMPRIAADFCLRSVRSARMAKPYARTGPASLASVKSPRATEEVAHSPCPVALRRWGGGEACRTRERRQATPSPHLREIPREVARGCPRLHATKLRITGPLCCRFYVHPILRNQPAAGHLCQTSCARRHRAARPLDRGPFQ